MPVTGVGKGSAFVLKNKRRCLRIWGTGKGSQDVLKLPVVHVKHNDPHVMISGLLGESIQGRHVWIAPTRGTDYENLILGIRSECLTRLQEPESSPLDGTWKEPMADLSPGAPARHFVRRFRDGLLYFAGEIKKAQCPAPCSQL